MARFVYKAKNGPEKIIQGVIEADNQAQAVMKLGGLGLFILSVEEETKAFIRSSGGRLFFLRRVPLRVLGNFTRQLSSLLDSGMSVLNALGILIGQEENPYFKQVITSLRDDIKDGAAFSACLLKYPKVFSNLYISMVSAGEISGSLEEVLSRLSDFMEKDEENISKIRSSMAYPALMAVVGFATVFVLLAFIAPRLTVIFLDMGQVLPFSTKLLILISSFFARFWFFIIIISGAALGFFISWSKTGKGKFKLDKIKVHAPFIKVFVRKREIARFARTLATLIENGVALIQSLSVAAGTIDNLLIKRDLEQVKKDVMQGEPLSACMKNISFLPSMAISMIAVGEESGQLERSLYKIADIYDADINRIIKAMTSLLEPGLILFMGIIVGFIVIAMLLPIFQLNLMVK